MKRFDLFNLDSLFSEFDSLLSPMIKGSTKTEKGEDENGNWVKQTFTSNDGRYQSTTIYRTNKSKALAKEPTKLDQLRHELQEHVETQNYEKAAEIRDEIKLLQEHNEKINEMQQELDKAVKEQNFELAIELRDKLKEMK